jgi:hypothetical protein
LGAVAVLAAVGVSVGFLLASDGPSTNSALSDTKKSSSETLSAAPTPIDMDSVKRTDISSSTANLDGDPFSVNYIGTSSEERMDVELTREYLRKLLDLDDIAPIYEPRFVPVSEADLPEGDYVLGVVINGDARAYDINILTLHEMVNDTVGGVPVLVTW